MSNMSKIITTSYSGPDLDGYGCSVAYAELLRAQGKDAQAHVWGDPHLEVEWFIENFGLERVGPTDMSDVDVVLLDTSDLGSVPGNLQVDRVIEIIDHRKLHEAEKFPNATAQIELVGAAATLVAERFQEAGVDPSKESALFLLGGIISNTQDFTVTATTERDHEMAKWLREVSGAPDDLARQMFVAKSDLSGDRLRSTLLSDMKILTIQGRVVGTSQLEIIGVKKLVETRRDEIQDVVERIRDGNNAEFMFLNMKDLDLGKSYVLCADQVTKDLMEDATDIEWNGRLGLSSTLTVRKQLTSWLNDKLA